MRSESNNLVFFSSCFEAWGGSEELWSQAAEVLAQKGFKIYIFKLNIDFSHPRIKRLSELGCQFMDLNEYAPPMPRRIWNRFLPYHRHRTLSVYIKRYLAQEIKRLKPKLFVISQGSNFDALDFFKFCPLDRFPYVVISQKADKTNWPADWERKLALEIWQHSARNYFVSRENQIFTEEQFGLRLEKAEVVRNPFLTKVDEALPWEFSSADKIRLACVGRLYPLDKGQDILLRVLSDRKWRERNIEVSFFGKGVANDGLQAFARYLGLENVVFNGHVSDIVSIWQNHQALVLPSRNEGLPLALVEAMLCGRTAIVTDVGGNREVLEDNVTGFMARSADETAVDEALERAWQRAAEWEQIGKLAALKIRTLVPANPAEVFAEKLIAIIKEKNIPDAESLDE